MKIQEVILRAASGEISWIQAAHILRISARSLRRWKRRFEEHGSEGLLDKYGPMRVIDTPISEEGFTGVGIGAGLGAAVDYELMQQIYLQLSTPLMQVGWRADQARQTGETTSEATTWQAAAVISPSLELRFVF